MQHAFIYNSFLEKWYFSLYYHIRLQKNHVNAIKHVMFKPNHTNGVKIERGTRWDVTSNQIMTVISLDRWLLYAFFVLNAHFVVVLHSIQNQPIRFARKKIWRGQALQKPIAHCNTFRWKSINGSALTAYVCEVFDQRHLINLFLQSPQYTTTTTTRLIADQWSLIIYLLGEHRTCYFIYRIQLFHVFSVQLSIVSYASWWFLYVISIRKQTVINIRS